MSTAVAFTGISMPIALSFCLNGLVSATALQAFAAGSALCSTSLGTTFTILTTSDLTNTRLGVVLTTAAMMDDVFGLIMVPIISNLGEESSSFSASIVVRPVLVSLGLVVALIFVCRVLVRPMTLWFNSKKKKKSPSSFLQQIFLHKQTIFLVHTLILLTMIAGASYAGTSNLFAAYLTGVSISWWDSDNPHSLLKGTMGTKSLRPRVLSLAHPAYSSGEPSLPGLAIEFTNTADLTSTGNSQDTLPSVNTPPVWNHSGVLMYQEYYEQVVNHVFKPFFFVS
ncbi:hypothetical protein MMC19_004701 [Ptychographa xylographoides]|nr:hypothetical protein [Ptychographa xylographoides]